MPVMVGVISDTHGLLRPEVLNILKACDFILHGGDAGRPEVLNALRAIAPLYVVRGNNDTGWAERLPTSLAFSIGNLNFFMVHDQKEVPQDLDGTDVVVFGHSHRYFERQVGERLWLNPGSCGRRRFNLEITMAVMSIDDGNFQVEKINIC